MKGRKTVEVLRWEANYKLLKTFAEREGHAQVPQTHVEKEINLGSWVAEQRKRNIDLMPLEQKTALESLKGWSWVQEEEGILEEKKIPEENKNPPKKKNYMEERWERAFLLLEQFIKRNGHPRVPKNHIESGFGLGQWVNEQRKKHGDIPLYRKERLERLAGWSWSPRAEDWNRAFELLKQYIKREGHSQIPRKHLEDGFKLGVWVSSQRSKRDTRSLEQLNALESIEEWTWEASHVSINLQRQPSVNLQRQPTVRKKQPTITERWERAFLLLEQFTKRNGHSRVPKNHIESGFSLGEWVNDQRRKDRDISLYQKERLERLAGWSWSPKADNWNRALELLKQYIKREGHSQVPCRHVEDGFKLGVWVSSQRTKRDTRSLEQLKALESIEEWTWEAIPTINEGRFNIGTQVSSEKKPPLIQIYKEERKWRLNYDLLMDFVKREGHAGVPQDHIEGKTELGAWVDEQIETYAEGTLTEARRKRLEQIPSWRWPESLTKEKQRFIDKDLDRQAEDVFEILFGCGPILKVDARELIVKELQRRESVTDKEQKSSIRESVEKAVKTALEYGYLDQPRKGFIRAVIPSARDYEPDDWRMCIEKALGKNPKQTADNIKKVIYWAIDNTGLEIEDMKTHSYVREQITKNFAR